MMIDFEGSKRGAVVVFICVLRTDSRIQHFAQLLSVWGGADGDMLPLSS